MQGRLSLRERLVLVTLAAILPMVAITAWVVLRESNAATAQAESQLKFAASLLAANQDRALDAAEQLLGAISVMPQLQSQARAECQAYFESLRGRYPGYSNIGLLAVDGRAVCHAQGAVGTASAADRAYFREAMTQRRLVMGEPIKGRLSGRAAIPFAMPVVEGGEVTGVVFATLDLENASAALRGFALPEGARVLVTDRLGNALMEHPPLPSRPELPRKVVHQELLAAARTLSSGVGTGFDGTGDNRIFAFAPSRPVGDNGFMVRVGMSQEIVTAAAATRARDAIVVLGLALLAAIAGTWWIGGRMIVKPAKQILGAVRRLERGSLDARLPLQGSSMRGEYARIGAAFNLMAESLQLRQLDLEAELGRSRSAYAVLDQVLNSMQEGLVAVTTAGQFLMYNEAAARLFPLDGPAVLPEQWAEHFGVFHPDGLTPYASEELPLVRSALGESGRQQLIHVRNALVPDGRLLQCSWQPIHGDGGVRGGLVVFTDVTELQRLEAGQATQLAQLQDTQRKLIEAQRIGRVGNWELHLRSGRLWWSDEVHELFGVGREDFDGTLNGFVQRVHPDDRNLHKPARDSALRDGQVMDLEYRIVKPDGSIAWMHEVAEARRDASGEPVWFGGMVQDVTSRKINEQALLASERELQGYTLMLQRAAEAAQAITARATLEDTLQEVAAQAARVIGTRSAAVNLEGPGTGPHLGSHFGEGDPDAPAGPVLSVPLVGRSPQPIGRLRLWGRAGGSFTERDQFVALELAQLASIAIENATLFTQIRELNAGLEARIAERTAELTRQEQLYRTLAEQAPEVVWNTDASGTRLTFLNHAWYDLVGGTPADWLGKSGMAAIHPEDRDAVAANWLRSGKTSSIFTGVRRVRAKDGTYHTMSYKAAPVLDAGGQVAFWVGIDADITEFKAIERALRSSNQELEAFSYSVSHDLRAPLGAIGGFSRALALKLEGHADERVHHYLSRIQAGVEKMEQLIESLLSLAKVVRAPLSYGRVDLSAIARETMESLGVQHAHRKGVSVRVEEGLEVQGDARLLRLVMENLLGNAWKFTSRSETAVIEVGRQHDAGIFFVRDNGVGFDMAYASKLFSAFQRLHTEAEFPGTGIGLATVRRIIARHQGRVWAESEVGRGTTFYFSLSDSAPPAWLVGDAPG